MRVAGCEATGWSGGLRDNGVLLSRCGAPVVVFVFDLVVIAHGVGMVIQLVYSYRADLLA